jgi:HTH-type transcriptional regulator/antitoxin HigA
MNSLSPGEFIRRELIARNWTESQFAELIGRPVDEVNDIIGANKVIDSDLAAVIGNVFGTSLNLENRYRNFTSPDSGV